MFAVGYGSYDFMKQGSGLICGFSLKNPSYPEFTFTTETGVMCLDWHPTHNALLCVGLYDGTVCVFDVHQARNLPIFTSTVGRTMRRAAQPVVPIRRCPPRLAWHRLPAVADRRRAPARPRRRAARRVRSSRVSTRTRCGR